MKLVLSIPQLSNTLPPADKNSDKSTYIGISSILHCVSTSGGHVISGTSSSRIVIICSHIAVLPHRSEMVYTLVTISGHVALLLTSESIAKLPMSIPQLSIISPPASINSSIVVNGSI